jgi:hypothetical protein
MHDVNTVVKKECYIDGMQIKPVWVQLDPAVFPLTIHEDNGVGVIGGDSPIQHQMDIGFF